MSYSQYDPCKLPERLIVYCKNYGLIKKVITYFVMIVDGRTPFVYSGLIKKVVYIQTLLKMGKV